MLTPHSLRETYADCDEIDGGEGGEGDVLLYTRATIKKLRYHIAFFITLSCKSSTMQAVYLQRNQVDGN